jgi:hypothetical protein
MLRAASVAQGGNGRLPSAHCPHHPDDRSCGEPWHHARAIRPGTLRGQASPFERTRHVERVGELQDHSAQSVLIIPAQERCLHAVVLVDHEDSSE